MIESINQSINHSSKQARSSQRDTETERLCMYVCMMFTRQTRQRPSSNATVVDTQLFVRVCERNDWRLDVRYFRRRLSTNMPGRLG